jgi:ammonium transporter, Amt family
MKLLSRLPEYEGNQKLNWSAKLSRLTVRLRDPEWRKYGMALLAGKMLGLAILLVLILGISMWLKSEHTYADPVAATQSAATVPATTQAAAPLTGTDIINPINTVWTLIAAFLVFGMQVGFTMLEAGFCRSRETVNVLVECVFDTCLCGILY